MDVSKNPNRHLRNVAGLLAVVVLSVPDAVAFTQRVANTTISLPQNPVVSSTNFNLVNAWSGISFTRPIGLVVPPGETNRMFIIEQRGIISVIPDLSTPTKQTFLDIESLVDDSDNEEGLLGLAFHPGYATNGFFYVFYTGHRTAACPANDDNENVLSRFSVSTNNPNAANTGSEVKLLSQCDDQWNHNGGDLHFGPDEYLYVALGDEGSGNDGWNNSQQIDKDFFSAIARIDVDCLPGNLAPNAHAAIQLDTNGVARYKVPADNPWVGATNFVGSTVNSNSVRTEFYAVGLRNPWRFSFDLPTGRIYCGDVGQNAREEIDIIVRGGNYGWRLREGFIQTPSGVGGARPPGNVEPILDYVHNSTTAGGFSVTGGFVYRGTRFPDLLGRYLFADYVSGNLWSLYYDGTNATQWTWMLDDNGIAGFHPDPRNGDVLVCDRDAGIVKRMLGQVNSNIPQTLDDAGIFADLENLVPHAGIEPYDLNVPFWSDGAMKTRWFSVPDTNDTMTFQAEGNWSFPTGSVWIKHFDIEITNGVPATRRRLETRLLLRTGEGAVGLTYRWGQSVSNAVLVPAVGLDEEIVIYDGGVVRTQVWHYPSQAECMQCHTPAAGHVLGFRTVQLNRDFPYGHGTQNQVQALEHVGYLVNEVPPPGSLRALASPGDPSASLSYRVRSYLQANCAQCHIPGGSAQGEWNADVHTPLSMVGIIDGDLINNQGNVSNRVVRRGDTAHSVMLSRISTRTAGQMPPIASTRVDTQAVDMLTQWIQSLADYQTMEEWQEEFFGSTNHPDADLAADPDRDGGDNRYERLTRTSPTNANDVWQIDGISYSNGTLRLRYLRLADVGFEWLMKTSVIDDAWQHLDVPENEIRYAGSNENAELMFSSTNWPDAFFMLNLFDL